MGNKRYGGELIEWNEEREVDWSLLFVNADALLFWWRRKRREQREERKEERI